MELFKMILIFTTNYTNERISPGSSERISYLNVVTHEPSHCKLLCTDTSNCVATYTPDSIWEKESMASLYNILMLFTSECSEFKGVAPILKVANACLSTEVALSIEIRAALLIWKTKKGLSLLKQYSFHFAVAVTHESILIKSALTLIRPSLPGSSHLNPGACLWLSCINFEENWRHNL